MYSLKKNAKKYKKKNSNPLGNKNDESRTGSKEKIKIRLKKK